MAESPVPECMKLNPNDPYAATGACIRTQSILAGFPDRPQVSLADLQGKIADMAADIERLKIERRTQARLEATSLPEAPKSALQKTREVMMTKRGEVIGEKAVAQEFALPKIEQSVFGAFQAAKDLLAHPGFEAATGLPNPYKGGFGLFDIPGTPAGDYRIALRGAVAEAFVPAFETLKGAGAITEADGRAALASLANLGSGMSEAQFTRELQRYINKLAAGLKVARKQSSMGGSPFTYEDLMREKRRRKEMRRPR